MNHKHEIKRRFLIQEEFLGTEKPVNKIQPLVTVRTMTYQHREFIEECIKGVIMQKTNFPFEFIIGEDGSTDDTREICEKYAKEYPDIIRLFNRDRSLTQLYDENGNFIKRLNGTFISMSSRGKYVAICEGDDFWTDPLKLQKQADFLEANQDYTFCAGGFERLYQDSGKRISRLRRIKANDEGKDGYTISLEEMQPFWIIQTLTVMFRSSIYEKVDFSAYKFSRDTHLFYHLLKEGNGFYFTNHLGVHRIHPGGVHSMKDREELLFNALFIYKELYLNNKDEFTRLKYLKNIVLQINFNLYSKKTKGLYQTNFMLFKEAMKLLRNPKEIKYMLIIFLPESMLEKLRSGRNKVLL
jgi:glycosyltransferase involved in cell wall biosynthesis